MLGVQSYLLLGRCGSLFFHLYKHWFLGDLGLPLFVYMLVVGTGIHTSAFIAFLRGVTAREFFRHGILLLGRSILLYLC